MSTFRCQCTHELHLHNGMAACKRCTCKFFKPKAGK